MKKLLNWSICALLFILVFACQPQTEEPGNSKATQEVIAKPSNISAEFYCRPLTTNEDMPQFEVSLYLNSSRYIIDTILSCNLYTASDYAKYDIPKEAISACGGWWAGGGDYFYAVVQEDVCTVMQGWQDEEQEDEGFHYERLRSFKVISR